MKKFIALLISVTGVAWFHSAAIAQEIEGCFMVNSSGRVVSLANLCGGTVSTTTTSGVFQAKIKRREGGTPVIDVTFDGKQTFEMIVDTGASGTVLTQKNAAALGVVPVAKIKASTASAKDVVFPIGYVKSIAVGGAVVKDVPVGISGPEVDTGLLGYDFFGSYDVMIKRDLVEFHPRQIASKEESDR